MPSENPLKFFKELFTIPKILVLVGFVVITAGLTQNISFHNPTIVFGTTAILLALTIQTFTRGIGHNPHPPYNLLFDWEKFLGGFVLFVFTAIS